MSVEPRTHGTSALKSVESEPANHPRFAALPGIGRIGPSSPRHPSPMSGAVADMSGMAAISLPIPAEAPIRIDPATGHPPVELFYDSIADEFDDVMNMYDLERRLHVVFDVFLNDVDLRGMKLLDAGCGTGWFSRAACERGAHVTALDIGPRLLGRVREKCDAETVVGDVLDLEFDSDSFDVVISSEFIEHTR